MDGYYLVSAGTTDSPAFPNISQRELISEIYELKKSLIFLPDFYAQYVKAIEGRNFITVTGPQEIIDKIRDNRITDQPRRQVMIDAVVTEISEKKQKTWE